jgi:hypothetical protein
MANPFNEFEKLKISCVKDYLDHIDELDDAKSDAEMRIAVIRDMAQPGGVRYDAINVSTSPSDDAIPNAVAALEDVADLEYLIEQIDKEKDEFCEMLKREIKSFGGTSLLMHYELGARYSDIAASAGIDRSTELNMRRRAMLDIYDKGFLPLEYRIPVERAI